MRSNKSEKYFPLIERYYRGNLSARVFSEQNGINKSTFEYWKARYRRRNKHKPGFAAISVVDSASQAITLHYADGTRLLFSGSACSFCNKTIHTAIPEMISFNSSQRFFLYRGATDMRKSFDGLCGLVTNELQKSLTTGDVFIFINKPRNSIKLLVWDRSGYVIYYKRLEEGTFELPSGTDEKSICIKWDELVMMLEGIALKSVKRRKRYSYLSESMGLSTIVEN